MFLHLCVCQLLSLYQSDMHRNVLLIKLWTWWNVTMLHLTHERLWFFIFLWFCLLCAPSFVCSKWPCHLVVLQPQIFLSMRCTYTNFTIKPHNKATFIGGLWQAAELIAWGSRLDWSLQPERSGLWRPLCFLIYSLSPNQNLSTYENTVRTHRP